MNDLLKVVAGLLALVVIGFAIRGFCAWLQDRTDLAWENRSRIGFQPNPDPKPTS